MTATGLLLLSLPLVAQAADAAPPVKTRVYLSADKLVAGTQVPFAVKATVAEGWHVNAQPPSADFLIPIKLTVTSTAGSQLVQTLYPAGHTVEAAGMQVSVYESDVWMFGTLDVPAGAVGQTESLTFVTSYQACNDTNCLPEAKAAIKGKIGVVAPGTEVRAMNASVFQRRPEVAARGTVILAK